MTVYEKAVIEASVAKYSGALAALRKNGVTVRDLAPGERAKMARAIEPWVNTKAQEFAAQGHAGTASFRRLIQLVKAKGGKPVHEYNIK